ncbi:MAG: acyl carrier protein [Acidobacteria bacterium]|nr:MAG: acyl carrier protein [Acidobacteriota bacterium]
MNGLDRLKHAFMEALGITPGSDFEPWNMRKRSMSLVAEIENAFDIMLAAVDVIDMSSFHKAKEILAKYEVSLDS